MKNSSLIIIAAITIGCGSNDDLDTPPYYHSNKPIRLIQKVAHNDILYDAYIDGSRFIEKRIISAGPTSSFSIPDTFNLTVGPHQIRIEFYYQPTVNTYNLIAELSDDFTVDGTTTEISFSADRYFYPDLDADGVPDIHKYTLESIDSKRIRTTGFTPGDWGPDLDIANNHSMVEALNQMYGYVNNIDVGKPELQIAKPSPNWTLGSVPSQQESDQTLYYIYPLTEENGICTGEFRNDSISSIRSNVSGGTLLMLFNKDETEFLVPIRTGYVPDLGGLTVNFDRNQNLNDSLKAVIAPVNTTGWFTVWENAGSDISNPSCSFNLTTPNLVDYR